MTRTGMFENRFLIECDPPAPVETLRQLASLGPFRKGPFRIDGIDVDSHWNSDAKWQVLRPLLERSEFQSLLLAPRLRFADVGANNGYYLFRLIQWLCAIHPSFLSESGERRFIAFDPVEECRKQFEFLFSLLPDYPLQFEMEGWQQLKDHPPCDIILCMGVLYHHTDPVEILRALHGSLDNGGRLILETMIVPSREDRIPFAIIPDGRYAGARGIWSVPDVEALEAMFRRTGWRNVVVEHVRTAIDEQQRFHGFPSFRDMLDPHDSSKTVEGLPAPLRAFVTAQK